MGGQEDLWLRRFKCQIKRIANSSSGTIAERWGVEYHRAPRMVEINRDSTAHIQYADVADLVKMLDRKTGNSLQDGVNNALRLLEVPSAQVTSTTGRADPHRDH